VSTFDVVNHDARQVEWAAMGTPGTTQSRRTADEAWSLMGHLWHANKRRYFAAINEFDLSPPQALALRHLEPGSPLPMSALAGLLHCDNSNITGIVDRLEDRGLVERRPAAHDRRIKHLLVTDRGAEVRERLAERMDRAPEELDRLTKAEQRQLLALLRKVAGQR
jgi:DNA-binding MarR family transcriptional regulator